MLTTYEALKMAREAGVDLVEVSPNVRPPVCRLIDYGKWKYSQKKNVKKHHEQLLKEVRLRPKTDTHDREIKVRRAIKFLKEGHKVQFTMVFRGREQHHREIGFGIFRQLIEAFGTRTKIERPPGMEGRHMIMILSALKGALDGIDMVYPPPKAEKTAAAPVGTVAPAPSAGLNVAPRVAGVNVAPLSGTSVPPVSATNVAPPAGPSAIHVAPAPVTVAPSAVDVPPAPPATSAIHTPQAPAAEPVSVQATPQ